MAESAPGPDPAAPAAAPTSSPAAASPHPSPAAAAPAASPAAAQPSGEAAPVGGSEGFDRPETLLGSLSDGKEPAPKTPEPSAASDKKADGEKPAAAATDGKREAKADDKEPAKASKEGEPEPAEGAPAAVEPIDRAVYAALKMPDGVTAEPAMMSELTDILSKRAVPLEAAQDLLGLHGKAMEAFGKKVIEEATRNQFKVFNEMVSGWAKQAMADPEFGGAGFQTSKAAMARMRDKFASSADPSREPERFKKEVREMDQGMALTGAGSAPWLLRFMHNVARAFDEAAYPSQVGRPSRTNGQMPKRRLSDHYTTHRSGQ